MFVHPLSVVGSVSTAFAIWRHWYHPRFSCWISQSPLITTGNTFNYLRKPCIFLWSMLICPGVLLRCEVQRQFYLSSILMEHTDKEPPLKRRKSVDQKESCGSVNSSLRASRAQSPAWLFNAAGVTFPPRKFSPSLVNTRTKTELNRQWVDLTDFCSFGTQDDKCSQAFDFSVMSYNILSQDLLLSNPYLYKHCNPHILDWRHRFTNIMKELEQHSADIMCLQEVQEDHYKKQIKPCLESLGYHCEYKRRTGQKLDGCMVAFKLSRFTLFSSHPVEFYRNGIPPLDRDNVGLVVLLQPVEAVGLEHSICVATTHLLYNPRRGDIKLAQLALLLAEISRVAQLDDGTTCPVLLCGDFNSVPASPLYNFIKDGKLEYAGMSIGKVSGQEQRFRGQRILTVPIWPPSLGISQLCQYKNHNDEADVKESEEQTSADRLNTPRIEHKLKLNSVYSHYLKDSGHSEITTCQSRMAVTVDYIFYSPLQQDILIRTECDVALQRGLQLLARLALVGEADLRETLSVSGGEWSCGWPQLAWTLSSRMMIGGSVERLNPV